MVEHERTLASPLTLLLEEEGKSAGGTDELLLLSFSLDLGFFERTALGVAQALGARVTVVGDAYVARPDVRAVRRAGRGYLNGLAAAAQGGAFHPKLMVLAGADRATVAIGSGNTTMAGWHSNEELWSVLRADIDSAPAAVTDLADFLRRLSRHVRFSARVDRACERVADLLQRYPATADSPTLVHSLARPILDQLPHGPVDQLIVHAPFLDAECAALRRIIDRMSPRELTVAVQPALGVFHGDQLAAVVNDAGGQLIKLAEERYRHGKLIEWSVGDRRWALTGSPNISIAALGQPMAQGGNCELGLISTIQGSLAPEGEAAPTTLLAGISYPPREEQREALVLLGATLTTEGLDLLFASAPTADAVVEISAPGESYETWTAIGDVHSGQPQQIIGRLVAGGSRLRVRVTSDVDDVVSNIVFVVDPARALHRPVAAGELRPTTEPFDLFRDTGLAGRFVADLEAMRPLSSSMPKATSAAPRGSTSTTSAIGNADWEHYLDECAGRIGRSLMHFALGLPQLDHGEYEEPDDDVLEDVDLTTDTTETIEEEQASDDAAVPGTVAAIPSLRSQSDWVRSRYRGWATKLADIAHDLNPVERLAAVRLVLWVVAAGAWERQDLAWTSVLGRAARSLGDLEQLPPNIERSAGSLAAVITSILRAAAPRAHWSEQLQAFEQTAATTNHLFAAADAAYVGEYAALLQPMFGSAVDVETVEALAEEVVDADPVEGALRAAEELGWSAHAHGRVIHIEQLFANPAGPALRMLGQIRGTPPVGAWAGSGKNWALLIWAPPRLLAFVPGRTARLWRLFKLPATLALQSLAELPVDFAEKTAPGHTVPLEAQRALEQLGIDLQGLPGCAAANAAVTSRA